MLKRLFCLNLALCMLISMFPVTAYATEEISLSRSQLAQILVEELDLTYDIASSDLSFTDLDGSEEYYEAAIICCELGILSNYDDGSFSPDGAVFRNAGAKVLYTLGVDGGESDLTPADMDENYTFYSEICAVLSAGAMSLRADGSFAPTEPLYASDINWDVVREYRSGATSDTPSEFAGGDGTEESPYLIETKEHLDNVRNYLDAHFKMTADIVFTKEEASSWESISQDGYYIDKFTGTFDGNNHIIANLYQNTSSSFGGLFGWTSGATIKNLGMVDSNISAGSSSQSGWGVGGIVGYANETDIINCYNTGNVSGSGDYTGGIVGYASDSTIINCYNTGPISGNHVGGICGNIYSSCTVTNCYNTGRISGVYAGGIADLANFSTIENCYSNGAVSSANRAGGIAARGDRMNISNCYNTGIISSSGSSVGGILGTTLSSNSISNCYNTGDISSDENYAGGIVGYTRSSNDINDCYNTGNVRSGGNYAGGISGYISSSGAINCYNIGNISSNGDCVGGICGYESSSNITKCYYLDNCSKGVGKGTDTAVKCSANQLTQQTVLAGFDFENVWTMAGDEDYPYPELQEVAMVLTLTSIKLSQYPTKVEYLEGKDTLSVNGGKLILNYTCGVCKAVDLTAVMVTGFDNTKVGNQTLTVTYEDKTTVFNIVVIPKSLIFIDVSAVPTKTYYLEGKDALNLSGGKVTLYYNNDTSEVIDLTTDMVSGFDNSNVGKQALTVTYEGLTTTFEVEVIAKSLTSIEISPLPTKTDYLAIEEELDLSGGKIVLYYNNDTSEVIDLTADMVSGFDNSIVGKQTLTVTHAGMTDTFHVEVFAKAITSMELTYPNKLSYLEGKDSLDVSGGKITLYYYNGNSEVMDLTADMVSGFDNSNVGKQTLTVTYAGFTDTFEIEIIGKTLTAMSISTVPTKLSYLEGKDTLDVSGGRLFLTYDNGSGEIIDFTEDMVSGFDNTKVGEQTLTVSYGEFSDTFKVCVESSEFSGGCGTADFPYLIATKADLNNVRNYPSAYFKMTADIVFTAADFLYGGELYDPSTGGAGGWKVVGTLTEPFSGTFDGNNHKISNLSVNVVASTAVFAGLFGYVSDATIKNLIVENADIHATATNNGNAWAGAIAAYAYGKTIISGCSSSGNIYASATDSYTANAGGIVGYAASSQTKVENCSNMATVTATSNVYESSAGGIVGRGYGSISNCSNAGQIDGVFSGGIVGYDNYISVTKCYNSGRVYGYNYAGGIVGYGNSQVSLCYNSGTVGGSVTGGIVGYDWYCAIDSCYNTGKIEGSYAGGIVGDIAQASVTSCYNVGNVAGNSNGGIAGLAHNNAKMTNCYYIDANTAGSGGGESLDTAVKLTLTQMQQQSTFAGFDFESSWQMGDGNTYLLPTLRGVTHVETPTNTTEFAGGNGAPYSPYLISNKIQLNNARNYPNACFKMVANILFTEEDFAKGGAFYNNGSGWSPIGTDSTAAFTGFFDGDDHIIMGLRQSISAGAKRYGGLFGYTNGASIKNLGVAYSNISTSTASGSTYAGGIVGYASSSTIANCYNVGSVSGASSYIGGIVGYATASSVIDCYNTGTITDGNYAGGIVGYAYNTVISNCYDSGKVGGHKAGGIAGYANNRTYITDCYNVGNISGSNYAGGIIGYADSTITSCYNTGAISGSNYVGGIAGYAYNSSVTYCYYLDNVAVGVGSGADAGTKCTNAEMQYQGTFLGFNFANVWTMGAEDHPYPELRELLHKDPPENTIEFAGGNGTATKPFLVATTAHLNNVRLYPAAHFKMIADITITDADSVGVYTNASLNTYTNANLVPIGSRSVPFSGTFDGDGHTIIGLKQTISTYGNCFGGLFGSANGANIKNLGVVDSDITVVNLSSEHAYAGGLIGDAVNTTVFNCYNTGNLSGSRAGGIIGYAGYNTTVSNCYNTGNIASDFYASRLGGIIGHAGYNTIVSNCYNIGNLSGFNHTGGIVGRAIGSVTITDCYNSGNVSGSRAGGIVGYTSDSSYVSNCYNAGNISGGIAGGIVGYAASSTVSTCYNVGNITGKTKGAIVGFETIEYVGSSVNIDCYYLDNIAVGVGSGTDAGTKCTDAELQNQGTFLGFNFADVWAMGTGDYPYPVLKEIPHKDALENTTEFAGGNGTARKPFLVATTAHLNNVRLYPAAHFKMISDITITDGDSVGVYTSANLQAYNLTIYTNANLVPIGSPSVPFSGTFDGDGHTVTGLKQDIFTYFDCYGGLFGYTNGASIKNLGVINSDIAVDSIGHAHAGSIAGLADYTTITSCYSSSDITGFYAGGIVGYASSSTIANCYNIGNIANGNSAGGIVGIAVNSNEISNCYNVGSIVDSGYMGGIIGYANSDTTVYNCYNTGEISGKDFKGGIAGLSSSTKITNCYYLNNVSGGVGRGLNAGTKCTDAQMQSQSTFHSFNFVDVWTMEGATDYLYPELLGMPHRSSGAHISGTALSWNGTDNIVYVLYSSTVTDNTIKDEWTAGSYSGVVCTSTENPDSTTVNSKAMYSQNFSFYGVSSGNYKLAIFKPGKYVPKIISVSVNGTDVFLGQQKLWLYGDVTGDGKVNATDATNVLYYYTHKTNNSITTGDEATLADRLLCADVNLDGRINATDATQILSYYTHKANNAFNDLK